MNIADSQMLYYVNNKLKLPRGDRKKYLAQVDNLIDRFGKKATEDPEIGIIKFHKTGSLRKGTVLRPRGSHGVDADIAVYVDEENTAPTVLENLHQKIRKLLIKTYPGKKESDFTIQPRTLGIVFTDSGLEVDLVPIIPVAGPGDFGWQPSSRGEAFILTSVPGQLEFIRERKEQYPYFTALVRLIKHWRNYKELDDSLRSFTIELIVCYLQEQRGNPATLIDGLLRFFLYVAQSELREQISFNGKPKRFRDRVAIVDPVNPENNVARRLTDTDCETIMGAAIETWELLSAAQTESLKGRALDYCRQAFGPTFAIED